MTADEKQVFDYVDHFMQGPYYTEFLDLSFPGKGIYKLNHEQVFTFG